MSSKTRIAVIGAGAGGLCVARHFLADASRYDVVVFEQASQVSTVSTLASEMWSWKSNVITVLVLHEIHRTCVIKIAADTAKRKRFNQQRFGLRRNVVSPLNNNNINSLVISKTVTNFLRELFSWVLITN